MMKRYIRSIVTICLCLAFINIVSAGTHYKESQYAILKFFDKKSRTVALRDSVYKLRIGLKIHDSESKLPSISSLTVGEKIKFKTHKNRKTGQIEISEIWILHR